MKTGIATGVALIAFAVALFLLSSHCRKCGEVDG